MVNFVAENPLRPVQSQNIYWLSKWYLEVRLFFLHISPQLPSWPLSFLIVNTEQHSQVYVSSSHLVWAPENPFGSSSGGGRKKISKRFGTLIKSPAQGLNEMLERHRREVEVWSLERVQGSGSSHSAGGGTGNGSGEGERGERADVEMKNGRDDGREDKAEGRVVVDLDAGEKMRE